MYNIQLTIYMLHEDFNLQVSNPAINVIKKYQMKYNTEIINVKNKNLYCKSHLYLQYLFSSLIQNLQYLQFYWIFLKILQQQYMDLKRRKQWNRETGLWFDKQYYFVIIKLSSSVSSDYFQWLDYNIVLSISVLSFVCFVDFYLLWNINETEFYGLLLLSFITLVGKVFQRVMPCLSSFSVVHASGHCTTRMYNPPPPPFRVLHKMHFSKGHTTTSILYSDCYIQYHSAATNGDLK